MSEQTALNITVLEVEFVLFTGLFKTTVGAVVSTVIVLFTPKIEYYIFYFYVIIWDYILERSFKKLSKTDLILISKIIQ